jgi:hypothetical protein
VGVLHVDLCRVDDDPCVLAFVEFSDGMQYRIPSKYSTNASRGGVHFFGYF